MSREACGFKNVTECEKREARKCTDVPKNVTSYETVEECNYDYDEEDFFDCEPRIEDYCEHEISYDCRTPETVCKQKKFIKKWYRTDRVCKLKNPKRPGALIATKPPETRSPPSPAKTAYFSARTRRTASSPKRRSSARLLVKNQGTTKCPLRSVTKSSV